MVIMLSTTAAAINRSATRITRGTEAFSNLTKVALLTALRAGENKKKKLFSITAPNRMPKAQARINAGSSIMPWGRMARKNEPQPASGTFWWARYPIISPLLSKLYSGIIPSITPE
ncbi:hypothetical protein D3C76_1514800 [compost metagenome]